MFSVSSRTSAKTGVAPQWTITFAVAGQVIELVTTSSPGPTPSATSERCRAAVPDETASTCLTSRNSRMRASSSAVRGPVVSQPERSVSDTAAISSSVIAGGWNERNVLRRTVCIRGSVSPCTVRPVLRRVVTVGYRPRRRVPAPAPPLAGQGGLGGDAEDDRRGRRFGALERLLSRLADGEDRARPVGAAPERREDVARLAVDSHALDPLEPLGNLHRLEHAGRRD